MPDVTVDVTGDQAILKALGDMANSLEDLTPMWNEVGEWFRDVMERQFSSQGASGGSAWQPLSEAYRAWKERNYPGRPILVLTEDLRDSLTGRNSFTIERIKRDSAEFGTSVPYAAAHHYGRGRLPARPVLVITERDEEALRQLMEKYITDVARREGFL